MPTSEVNQKPEKQTNNKSEAINPNRLQNISQEEASSFVCKLCSMLLKNPLICKTCQTRYCEDCLNNWTKKNKSCPNQCKNFQKSTILKPIVESMSKLQISCQNKKHGCKETVLLGQLESHQQKCQFLKQQCKGCKKQFKKSQLDQHEQNCENLMIECTQCKFYILQKDLSSHSSEKCFNNKIEGAKNFFKQEIQKVKTQFQKEIDQLKNKNSQLQKQIQLNKQNLNVKNNKMQDLKILNNISLKSKQISKAQRSQNMIKPIQQLAPKQLTNLQMRQQMNQQQMINYHLTPMQPYNFNQMNSLHNQKINQINNNMNQPLIFSGQNTSQQFNYSNKTQLKNYLQQPLQQSIHNPNQPSQLTALQQQQKFK